MAYLDIIPSELTDRIINQAEVLCLSITEWQESNPTSILSMESVDTWDDISRRCRERTGDSNLFSNESCRRLWWYLTNGVISSARSIESIVTSDDALHQETAFHPLAAITSYENFRKSTTINEENLYISLLSMLVESISGTKDITTDTSDCFNTTTNAHENGGGMSHHTQSQVKNSDVLKVLKSDDEQLERMKAAENIRVLIPDGYAVNGKLVRPLVVAEMRVNYAPAVVDIVKKRSRPVTGDGLVSSGRGRGRGRPRGTGRHTSSPGLLARSSLSCIRTHEGVESRSWASADASLSTSTPTESSRHTHDQDGPRGCHDSSPTSVSNIPKRKYARKKSGMGVRGRGRGVAGELPADSRRPAIVASPTAQGHSLNAALVDLHLHRMRLSQSSHHDQVAASSAMKAPLACAGGAQASSGSTSLPMPLQRDAATREAPSGPLCSGLLALVEATREVATGNNI